MKTNEPHFDELKSTDIIFESDNPIYDIDKNEDSVATCAKNIFGINSLYPWQRLAIANILDAVNAVEAKLAENTTQENNISYDKSPDEISDKMNQIAKNSQEERISDIYDEDGVFRGRQIILLPTGAGKSLCFQVPALLMKGATLIIYPLLALMNDQFRRMQTGGLEPVIFRGGQTREERNANIKLLEASADNPPAKLIIANPEVLIADKILIKKIAKAEVSHLAIDEAHCVSEWGDSFRPAYLELNSIIKTINPKAITAFTATASPPVLKRIADILFDGKAHLVRGESDRPNIIYFVHRCRIKHPALLEEVKKRRKPMVVFCSSRSGTEQIASFLRLSLNNKNIRFYHAGLQKEEKNDVEKWFHNHKNGILVTTCAWGMGVDKKDVKTVIHYDPSPTAEAYTQEAGRAGRDGSISEAVLLWTPSDKVRINKLPEAQKIRAKVIEKFAESKKCRRQILLAALGEEKAIAKTPDEEQIACSGCDVCNNSAIHYNIDEKFLLEFIKKNQRAYSKEEITLILSENLENWRPIDIKSLIIELLKANFLKKHRGFFWKNKISIKNEY